jgi:transcription antitermination factor NusG
MKSGRREPFGAGENHEKVLNGEHNRLNVNAEQKQSVHSSGSNPETGQSVEYALCPDKRYWFPIRATYQRAKKVYDHLVSLNDSRLELYLPTMYRLEYADGDLHGPTVKEEPLDKGLLFLKATVNDFRALLKSPSAIPGLTPYYNHFHTNEFGKNEYLTVPERQMESFRIIVESRNKDIIVKQTEVPKIIEGDRVIVTDGPFAGVEGIVMKFRHQKRVFVQLQGVGIYATAYVPGAWLERVEN